MKNKNLKQNDTTKAQLNVNVRPPNKYKIYI